MNGDALAILSPRLAFCQTFFIMAVIIILENDEKSMTSCVYVINDIHTYIHTYIHTKVQRLTRILTGCIFYVIV